MFYENFDRFHDDENSELQYPDVCNALTIRTALQSHVSSTLRDLTILKDIHQSSKVMGSISAFKALEIDSDGQAEPTSPFVKVEVSSGQQARVPPAVMTMTRDSGGIDETVRSNDVEVKFERDAEDTPPILDISNKENDDAFFFGSALDLTNAQRMAAENESVTFDIT